MKFNVTIINIAEILFVRVVQPLLRIGEDNLDNNGLNFAVIDYITTSTRLTFLNQGIHSQIFGLNLSNISVMTLLGSAGPILMWPLGIRTTIH